MRALTDALTEWAAQWDTQSRLVYVAAPFASPTKEGEAANKKELVEDLRDAMKRALESPSVAVDYKERIKSLLADVDLRKLTDEKKRQLEKVEQFLAEEHADGKDTFVMDRLFKQVERLSKERIENVTMDELEEILDEVLLLEHVGRTKTASFEAVYQMRKEMVLNELVNAETGVKPVVTGA